MTTNISELLLFHKSSESHDFFWEWKFKRQIRWFLPFLASMEPGVGVRLQYTGQVWTHETSLKPCTTASVDFFCSCCHQQARCQWPVSCTNTTVKFYREKSSKCAKEHICLPEAAPVLSILHDCAVSEKKNVIPSKWALLSAASHFPQIVSFFFFFSWGPHVVSSQNDLSNNSP